MVTKKIADYLFKNKNSIDSEFFYKIFVTIEELHDFSLTDREIRIHHMISVMHPEFKTRKELENKLNIINNYAEKIQTQIDHLSAKQVGKAGIIEKSQFSKIILLTQALDAIGQFKKNLAQHGAYETLASKLNMIEAEATKVVHTGSISKIFKNVSGTSKLLKEFTKAVTPLVNKEIMSALALSNSPQRRN